MDLALSKVDLALKVLVDLALSKVDLALKGADLALKASGVVNLSPLADLADPSRNFN